jgi:hypothetical protein
MKYYRCYVLTDDDHIAGARVLKCADDAEAKRQGREVIAAERRFAAVEIWDGARRVCRYPEEPSALARARRRRKGDARNQDQAIADALSVQIAADRRRRMQEDAVKAAQLREQRLEREADSEMSASGTARDT